MALHFAYYNFCRIHQTLRITPAMAARVTDRVWELASLDSHAGSSVSFRPLHLSSTTDAGDYMGTARDRAPHRTPTRGLARPQPPRPYAYPSPAFITSAPPPRPTGTPRSDGCHQHLLYPYPESRRQRGRTAQPTPCEAPFQVRFMRIRPRRQTKTMPLTEEPVTSGFTAKRSTAASAG